MASPLMILKTPGGLPHHDGDEDRVDEVDEEEEQKREHAYWAHVVQLGGQHEHAAQSRIHLVLGELPVRFEVVHEEGVPEEKETEDTAEELDAVAGEVA